MIKSTNTITAFLWGSILGLAALGMASETRAAPVPPGHGVSSQAAASDTRPAGRRAVRYSRIPLYFEANRGQAPRGVRYISRGQGYALYLTGAGPVLALHRFEAGSGAARAAEGRSDPQAGRRRAGGSAVVAMTLVGANPGVEIRGRQRQAGVVNYLVGKDPKHWHRHVPTYRRVVYSGVYPGIDLAYHGRQNQLEYDFDISPGADPKAIRLSFSGIDGMRVDPAGRLHLQTGGGEVIEKAPVAYQRIGGVRRAVASRYVLTGAHQVSFALSGYDPRRPLVIDPVLSFSSYLGGKGNDRALAVAYGTGSGAVFITGRTASSLFLDNIGGAQTGYDSLCGGTVGCAEKSSGAPDAFVMSVGSDDKLNYATYLGGSGQDSGLAIAVDGSGDAFVAGQTSSWDFPKSLGAYQASCPDTNGDLVCDNGGNAFVVELGPNGDTLPYGTFFGGCYNDAANGIALDGSGYIYIAGFVTSASETATSSLNATCTTGLPVKSGSSPQPALQSANKGRTDAFVAKFDPTKSGAASLVYSTFLGGTHSDEALGIAVSATGEAYVTGDTASTDFPVQNADPQACANCDGTHYHAFVAKLNQDATALVYSTRLGGSAYDYGSAIAIDRSGNAYVTGWTRSPDFPTVGTPIQSNHGGDYDVFFSRFDGSGKLDYSTYLGTTNIEAGQGIAIDSGCSSNCDAWITGYTEAPDLLVALLRDLSQLPASIRPANLPSTLDAGLDFLQDFQSVDNPSSDSPEEIPDTDSPHDNQPNLNNYVLNNLSVGDLASALGQLDPSLDTPTKQTELASLSRSELIGKIFDVVDGYVQQHLQPIQSVRRGTIDAFAIKLRSTGASAYTVDQATYLGGRHENYATGIALDASGNPYVVGYTQATDFPVTGDALQSRYCPSDNSDNACGEDGFVAKIVKGDVDLSVTRTSEAPKPVEAGTNVTFTVRVKNNLVQNGPTLPVSGVQLVENVPIGLQLVKVVPADKCTPSHYDAASFNHTVTCDLGTLAPGQSVDVSVTVMTTAVTESPTQNPGTTLPTGPPPQVISASATGLATNTGDNSANVTISVKPAFIAPENAPHPALSQKFPTFPGIDPPGGGGAVGLLSLAALAGGAGWRRARRARAAG